MKRFLLYLLILGLPLAAGAQMTDQERQAEYNRLKQAVAWRIGFQWEGDKGQLLVIPGRWIQTLSLSTGIDYVFNIARQTAYMRLQGDSVWYTLPVEHVQQRLHLLPAFVIEEPGPQVMNFPTRMVEVRDTNLRNCGTMTTSPVFTHMTGIKLVDMMKFLESARVMLGSPQIGHCEFYDVRLFEFKPDETGEEKLRARPGWLPMPVQINFPDKTNFSITQVVPIMNMLEVPPLQKVTDPKPFSLQARLELLAKFLSNRSVMVQGKKLEAPQLLQLLNRPLEQATELPANHPLMQQPQDK